MYTIEIDKEHSRVLTTWGPVVTDAALMDYQKSVWSDPAVRGFDELIDFRGSDQIEVTTEGLEAVAHAAAAMDDPIESGRFAIVIRDTLSFGLSRMYEAFRELHEKSSRRIMIFHHLEEAIGWLDENQGVKENAGSP